MIAYLKGTLVHKAPTRAVVEVGGVGFAVTIPLSSFEVLGETGTQVQLLTYLHVREDGLELFGFATSEERETFVQLLSVTGIGPRLAHTILSGSSVPELRRHIASGDVDALAGIRGVGKKLAQRLVVDLQERMRAEERAAGLPPGARGQVAPQVMEDALLALISLGHTRDAAQKTLQATISQLRPDETVTAEELVKRALRNV